MIIKNLNTTKTLFVYFRLSYWEQKINGFFYWSRSLLSSFKLCQNRKTLIFSNSQYFIIKKFYQYYFELNNFNDVEMRLYYSIIDINYKMVCNVINNALKYVNILIFPINYLIGKIGYLDKGLVFLSIFYSVKLVFNKVLIV